MSPAITQTLELPKSGITGTRFLEALSIVANYTGDNPSSDWFSRLHRTDERTHTWFIPEISITDGTELTKATVRIKINPVNTFISEKSDWHSFVVTNGTFVEPLPLATNTTYQTLKLVSNWQKRLPADFVKLLAVETRWFANRVRDTLKRG